MDWTDVYKNNLLTRGGEGNDWKKGVLHIDIWTGGFAESGNGEKQIQCEERLTPDKGQLVVRNPPVDLKASSKYSYNTRVTSKSCPWQQTTQILTILQQPSLFLPAKSVPSMSIMGRKDARFTALMLRHDVLLLMWSGGCSNLRA